MSDNLCKINKSATAILILNALANTAQAFTLSSDINSQLRWLKRYVPYIR